MEKDTTVHTMRYYSTVLGLLPLSRIRGRVRKLRVQVRVHQN